MRSFATLLPFLVAALPTGADDPSSLRWLEEAPRGLKALETACSKLVVRGRESLLGGGPGQPDELMNG